MNTTKRDFLVGYDYGMGGLWAIVTAQSEDEILARYPELVIVKSQPAWMSAGDYLDLMRAERHDIDERPAGVLKAIVGDRLHE